MNYDSVGNGRAEENSGVLFSSHSGEDAARGSNLKRKERKVRHEREGIFRSIEGEEDAARGYHPACESRPLTSYFQEALCPSAEVPPSIACRRPCKYLHQILPAYKKKNTKIIFSFLLPFLKVLT